MDNPAILISDRFVSDRSYLGPSGWTRTLRPMRRPSLEKDYWDLESAEARHAETPDSFWIPDLSDREQIRPDTAVKLLFRIETEQADGSIDVAVERMWVYVTEQLSDGYIGLLDNQPGSVDASSDFYLTLGAEVPFGPEHVIAIAVPPPEFVEAMREKLPSRRWPRD